MMDHFQSIFSWLQADASWLQVVPAIVQSIAAVIASIAAVIAIRATLKAADRSARLAFELNKEKDDERLKNQIRLLRFSLALEIERNLENLRRFYDNFDPVEEQGENAETLERRVALRRFITLNMPDLSYRFWHNQELSSLLPLALTRSQIRDVNRIYSDFDRLSKIGRTFGEEALQQSKTSFLRSGETAIEGAGLPRSSANEFEKLLDEFEMSLNDVRKKVNPLKDDIDGDEEDRYISEGVDRSGAALQTRPFPRTDV